MPHLAPFSLVSRTLEGHLYFTPPGQCLSKCWSKPSDVRRPLGNQGLCQPDVWLIRCFPENEICAAPIGIVGTSGGFDGLVLPLWKCLVTGIPRLIGSSREKEYPSLTVRAYNGLSWDTPAGYKISRVMPTVMWQMGLCQYPVVENLTLKLIKMNQPRV